MKDFNNLDGSIENFDAVNSGNNVSRNYFESYFDVELDKRLATIKDITIPLIKSGFIIDEKAT